MSDVEGEAPKGPLVFFFDACLSPAIGKALRALGVNIELLHETFPRDIKDPDLLPQVAARGWTMVTVDVAQKKKRNEAVFYKEHGLRGVFLPSSFAEQKLWVTAIFLVTHWQGIERQVRNNPNGIIFGVSMKGKAEVEWERE